MYFFIFQTFIVLIILKFCYNFDSNASLHLRTWVCAQHCQHVLHAVKVVVLGLSVYKLYMNYAFNMYK